MYGCTTWMQTKRLEKKLDGITQEWCEQYLTSPGGNTPQGTNFTVTCLPSRKLSKLDEPDMPDTAGKKGRAHKWCTPMDSHIWPSKSRTTSSNKTYSRYVRIRDVELMTWQRLWTIGRSGERGSGISVLAARHDDDEKEEMSVYFIYIYIYIYIYI